MAVLLMVSNLFYAAADQANQTETFYRVTNRTQGNETDIGSV